MQHSTIGPIRGVIKVPGITQFLGVQYATLRDRFAQGELLESYPSDHVRIQGGVFDATAIGYVPFLWPFLRLTPETHRRR